jgi:hypothetical protein
LKEVTDSQKSFTLMVIDKIFKKNTFRYYFDVFDKKGIKQTDMPLSYVQTQLHILNKTPEEILKYFFYYLNN